jgi:hypothetical protein
MKTKILLLSLALISSPIYAQVLVDNLSAPTPNGNSFSSTQWQSQAFTTDANSYWLTSVVLKLRYVSTGDLYAAIYSASGGTQPDVELGTFIDPGTTTGSSANVTFSADGSIALDENTTYWIFFGTETSGSYHWAFASNGQGASTDGPGVILNKFATSGDDGVSWSVGNTSSPSLIQVNVSAVPEPSAFGAILGVFTLAFVGSRRRSIRA